MIVFWERRLENDLTLSHGKVSHRPAYSCLLPALSENRRPDYWPLPESIGVRLCGLPAGQSMALVQHEDSPSNRQRQGRKRCYNILVCRGETISGRLLSIFEP